MNSFLVCTLKVSPYRIYTSVTLDRIFTETTNLKETYCFLIYMVPLRERKGAF